MKSLRDPSLLRSQCFVNGTWAGTPVDSVTNPATGEQLTCVPRFGEQEALDAINTATIALKSWSKLLAKDRATMLKRWYALIMENKDDIARILTAEQGKPLAEALGEVVYAASFIEYYAEEARRIYGETIPSHREDARILVLKQPIGVVAAITPWNFPAAMITRKAAPALAAGCTIVIKPAPETPLTALALAALAERAGLPAGVLNVITGDAPQIGKAMCDHDAVQLVGFTGSGEVGKILMRQAADKVKKVALELGGNAPFIVFDDADIDAAVEGAVTSKYRNSGQTCISANRIFVQNAIHDEFVGKLVAKVKELKVGNGLHEDVQLGPLITPEALAKVEQHVDDAIGKGARLLTGGKAHELGRTFFQPTVLTEVTDAMIIAHEETFGPVAPIYRFKDEEEVIRIANSTEYGLASYFYATDLRRVIRVAEALECGMVGVNTALLGVDVAPFGGVKQSGIGREGSHHGITEFVELKYVLLAGV
ncbi:MAG TPA: NAD-dependent succinate-semialdehyde dehydrogenase [Paraburkholderia sp.]|jgi:succinate-semialdehyde dehydrogenase/glutarate-semialdehyde dehydrogenase|nr:NAD-dependent succinate-semialdehyde dehydrogenase [Paraburkholderia sp.]